MKIANSQKPHIGIFGRRNVGKSSFINTLTGQQTAIVSELAGTTTDPVKKSMEIFGIGPAVIIDTAGIDDTGNLGTKRVEKSLDYIQKVDVAVLIIAENKYGSFEQALIREFNNWKLPFIIIHNKEDDEPLLPETVKLIRKETAHSVLTFSNLNPENKENIINHLKQAIPKGIYHKKSLLGKLVKPNDLVLLITPIDKEAPEGRMILPQQMVIRDILDHRAICLTVQVDQITSCLEALNTLPVLAITDSQAFETVKTLIPERIPLTSFSVLFAHHKGDFENYLQGTSHIDHLKDGDKVLILESCTHQVNCDDIGRIKLPAWIKKYTGKNIQFDVVSGLSPVPAPLEKYAQVIQCGGCMVTHKQLINRLKPAKDAGIPISNYGMSIAHINGILDRACQPFKPQNNEPSKA